MLRITRRKCCTITRTPSKTSIRVILKNTKTAPLKAGTPCLSRVGLQLIGKLWQHQTLVLHTVSDTPSTTSWTQRWKVTSKGNLNVSDKKNRFHHPVRPNLTSSKFSDQVLALMCRMCFARGDDVHRAAARRGYPIMRSRFEVRDRIRLQRQQLQQRLLILDFTCRVWMSSPRYKERLNASPAREVALLEFVVGLCEVQETYGNLLFEENPVNASSWIHLPTKRLRSAPFVVEGQGSSHWEPCENDLFDS